MMDQHSQTEKVTPSAKEKPKLVPQPSPNLLTEKDVSMSPILE